MKKKIILLSLTCLILVIGGIMILNFMKNKSESTTNNQITTAGEINGAPITAFQLGKSDGTWRNGAGTVSDGKDTNATNQPTRKITSEAQEIIIYFSRSGSTELLASMVAEKTGADILEIVVASPYAANYQKTLDRANNEREQENFPTLNLDLPNLNQYTTVYLGYPIWAMTLPHPMTSFLQTYGQSLSEKRIAPFMTQGGYGQGDSVNFIEEILNKQGAQGNEFTEALVVDGNKVDLASETVDQWLKEIKK